MVTDYQNAAYAERFIAHLVERTCKLESRKRPTDFLRSLAATALTEAVAR
jgi:hypothetical protein